MIKTIAIILISLGLLMILLPGFVGGIVIAFLGFALGFTAFGLIGTGLATRKRSILTIGAILLFLSGAVTWKPTMILTFLGIGLIASAVTNLFYSRNKRSIISSIILISIGVFAMVNSSAAINTIVIIIGLITSIVGCVVLLFGRSLSSYTYRSAADDFVPPIFPRKGQGSINIRQEDGAEEVDFKEIK